MAGQGCMTDQGACHRPVMRVCLPCRQPAMLAASRGQLPAIPGCQLFSAMFIRLTANHTRPTAMLSCAWQPVMLATLPRSGRQNMLRTGSSSVVQATVPSLSQQMNTSLIFYECMCCRLGSGSRSGGQKQEQAVKDDLPRSRMASHVYAMPLSMLPPCCQQQTLLREAALSNAAASH